MGEITSYPGEILEAQHKDGGHELEHVEACPSCRIEKGNENPSEVEEMVGGIAEIAVAQAESEAEDKRRQEVERQAEPQRSWAVIEEHLHTLYASPRTPRRLELLELWVRAEIVAALLRIKYEAAP